MGIVAWWKNSTHNVKNTYLVVFFLWAARSIVFQQILSGYVFVLTNSNKPVGMVKGIQGISQLLFSLPAGYLADITRRDTILVVSGVLGLSSALLTFLAIEQSSIYLLYATFALWGIFTAFQNPAMEAIFADSIPHGERSFPFMIKYNIGNLAMVLGPAICILLFVYYGDVWEIRELTSVLEFGAFLAAISAILLFRFNDDLTVESNNEAAPQDVEPSASRAHSRRGSTDQPLRTPKVDSSDMVIEYDYSDEEDDQRAARNIAAASEKTALLAEQGQSLVKVQDASHPDQLPVVQFWCFNSTQIPWLVFASDFIVSNGAGMTINFFPLFFKEEYGLTPIQVSILFLLQPLLVMVLSYLAQVGSKPFGRMPIIVVTRLLSVLCLLSMSFATPIQLQVVLFLMRGGMMRCSQPLRRSLLMDHVPKELRARWNALESISVFSWSGSAVLGGFIIDSYGYRSCFLITSCVYFAGMMLELVLLPLTKHSVEK